MSVNDAQLHEFYLETVRRLRRRGVLCAITSGLACVHYNVAETTKDCDLLCHPDSFGALLEVLSALERDGHQCRYRGNLSPPLDARWHRGGWTSHFTWGHGPAAVTLDVFGRALRGSMPWEDEISGLFINQHIVAEMKRTNRDKDWPFISLLGEQLLAAGDPRGWLHLFDAEMLARLARRHDCPEEVMHQRPVLRLARQGDSRLRMALHAERCFWEELDRLRIEILRRALRPFVVAVARAAIPASSPLPEQHTIRVRCAEATLVKSPLLEYGLERHLADAREATARLVHPEALEWLPDVTPNFNFLVP